MVGWLVDWVLRMAFREWRAVEKRREVEGLEVEVGKGRR